MDFKGAKKYILDRLEKELRPDLYYHGVHHTLDVYEASIKIAELENLGQEEKVIVNTAALYHDSGFIYQYENNEEVAVKLIEVVLPKFGYSDVQIKQIAALIMSTQIKHLPTTLLEKIMCDADYDYLGRSDVYKIADSLYKELDAHDYKYTPEEWNEVQLKFLNKHEYFTASSIALRRENKLAYYAYLKGLTF